jgi:bacteriorhodopsin
MSLRQQLWEVRMKKGMAVTLVAAAVAAIGTQALAAAPELSTGQFSLVYQLFSIAIASMGASFIWFVTSRQNLAPKYSTAMLVSALVVAVACYHYVRIFNSWNETYALDVATSIYKPTGVPFNDAYRYADWVLTVPLLLVEVVAVLALASNVSASMIGRLTIAAFLMIATGYPGEVSSDNGTRLLWGTISTIPFAYIVYTLFSELGTAMEQQTPRVRLLMTNLRLLLVGSWGFYPIAYLLPVFFGGLSASGLVGVQVGYSLADIIAKAGFGTLIYFIALEKTRADGGVSGVTAMNAAD